MSNKKAHSSHAPNSEDSSTVFDDVLDAVGQPEILNKFVNLLTAAGELVNELKPEEDTKNKTISGKGFLHTAQVIIASALNNPDILAKHYGEFSSDVLEVLRRESDLSAEPTDRRFKDKLWHDNAVYRGLMQIYITWGKHMNAWVEDQEIDDQDRQRVQFIFDQLIAALSPSNLPINPAALKRAENTEGWTAVAGIKNWIEDVRYNQCMPRQVNENAYTVGVDLGVTPGQVVYRNELLEVIQYKPQTEKVRRRPLIIIPPQINKFYIFDLKPKNSLIDFLVKHGIQMFIISWRNPDNDAAHWGLETYIKATLEAIEVVRAITRVKTVNLVSACAAGLSTIALLGYLAETKNKLVNSHSLLVTSLLPNSGSLLELFVTNRSIELARKISQLEGTMSGKDLAHIFSWLRPNDLVWNYWVNNYIMGRQPPALDVLFWDNDSTRLPATLHSDFIDMYTGDVFQQPNKHVIFGLPIDYRKVKVNTYFVAGREDYLMPWKGVYSEVCLFKGKHNFVLSKSGHVQSLLRPPHLPNSEFFINENLPSSPDEWLSSAVRHEGTWWNHWVEWLNENSGATKKSPKVLGNDDFPPIIAAPGEYVFERV